ncbi:MAG: hypothetical protein PHW04_17460 [Candidatus Wallbacteria bacterium]|nr:hypothetical protein [Candidatus Wallbacteria bacterium]
MKKRPGIFFIIFAGIALLCGIAVFLEYRSLFRIPRTRLDLEKYYPEMPPDDKHHYLTLPIDHKDKSKGQFKNYYILSPNFQKGGNVIFFLTDGQMELVDTRPDFQYFESLLPGLSYVLIGVRGQSPAFFPEVYRNDGSINFKEAMNLFDSDQQVEDIEAVRQDLLRQGLISADGKIMLLGASGAGVLAQQYLSRYGQHVSKTVLEVTGAPDLSLVNNLHYSRDLADLDQSVSGEFELAVKNKKAYPPEFSYLLYNLARTHVEGPKRQLELLQKLNSGKKFDYWKIWLNPQCNFMLASFLLSIPAEVSVKVRWFELTGMDLDKYLKSGKKPVNLLYEFSSAILQDFLAASQSGEIAVKNFEIQRSAYSGEVLIISGSEDVVFSPEIGKILAKEYKISKLALLKDGHRMLQHQDYLKQLRTAFYTAGFNSQEFRVLFDDPQQLNRE